MKVDDMDVSEDRMDWDEGRLARVVKLVCWG